MVKVGMLTIITHTGMVVLVHQMSTGLAALGMVRLVIMTAM